MSQEPISARLIGTPEFRSGDGSILPVTPKLAALMAYLDSRHPAMVPRTEVMDLLWGRMFTQQARQNLRKAMGRLRGVLGEDVLVTRGDLVGVNTARYESDTLALDRFITDRSAVTEAKLRGIAPAELLSGLDLDGERWSDWLAVERQHVQEKLLRALIEAARGSAEGGDTDSARHFAEQAIKLNPFAEDPRRIRMRALAGAGRESEAIQEYNQFAKILREELEIDPSPETQELLQAIQGTARKARVPSAPERPARASLAVMPIRVLGEVRRGAHLSAGLAAEIVTTLAKLSDLDIIDLTTQWQDGTGQAQLELPDHHAHTVLKSALQVVGDRVRLTAQLAEADSNRQIWAEKFDRWLVDLLDIQDSLTKDIVTQLQIRLTEGEQARVWSSGTENFDAWEAVVRATHLIHEHRRDGIREARRLAEGAVALDPDFASAHAAVGWTHWVEGRWSWSEDREASFQTAQQFAQKALSLDPVNPDARSLHGVVLVHIGCHDAAIEEMEQAVGLAPSHAHIAALAAYVHRYAGDPRRAIDLIDRAMWLSPGHPVWYLNTKGGALQAIGALDEAETALRDAHARDPQFATTMALLAALLGRTGRDGEAGDLMRRLLQRDPDFGIERWFMQSPYRDNDSWTLEKEGLVAAGAPP